MSKRKGRRFELDIYNELKNSIPDLHLSKWSGGTVDEPGDLFTKRLFIEVKHVKDFGDADVAK
jgi:hypothetical protein